MWDFKPPNQTKHVGSSASHFCHASSFPLSSGLRSNIKGHSKKAETGPQIPDFIDYDEYDAQVFRSSAPKTSMQAAMRSVSSATVMAFRRGSYFETERPLKRLGSREEVTSRKSFSPPPIQGLVRGVEITVGTRSVRKRIHSFL